VADLQDALQILVKKSLDGVTPAAYRPLDPPNSPTRQELETLSETLGDERVQTLYGDATQRLVLVFQLQNSLGDNLRGVIEDTTAAKLNEWLKKLGLFDTSEPVGFVVRGTVKTSDGQPISGANVYAFDRDMRKEQPLGDKAETDAQGQYTIRYGLKDFASGDVPSASAPKLIVRAFVGGLQIGQDVTRPKRTRDEVVDFQVPAPVLSEWENVSAGIIPLLEGQGEGDQALPPWEVNDGDLDFIAEETGLEREKIRLWALAFAMSRDAAAATQPVAVISEIFFYGWFRQGLPLDRNSLLERPTLELITEIRKSIEANFVPRALSDRLEGLEATLNRLRAARTLEPASEGKPSSLGDLLGTLPVEQMLSRDQQLTVARLSHEHGHTEEFWTRVEAAGLPNAIPALKRTLALGELSVGHARVVQALQAKSDAERPESIEFLTTLEPIDWIELVFEHGAPPGSGLDPDAYIERLQSEVEAKFPTQMLGKQLQKKLGESESFPTGKVVDFLKANPDFDLRKRHVEPYLNERDNRDDSLREGLLRLGRIHALTANARETMALHDAGFGSSTHIVSEGKPAFMLKVGNQLSAERAEQVFAAAEHVMTTVVAIGTAYVAPSASGNAVYVIPAQTVSETTLKEYPSLRSLFGDLDYCECRHCRSVLGPAAYLADLLHFLQRSPLTSNPDGDLSSANRDHLKPLDSYLEAQAGGTVLGALLQRRPDLADLEFSCENIDTKIPYIDLVLEILENAVALPMAVAIEGVDIDAAFTAGTVPVKVAEALRKTNITVGKVLHVTPDLRPGINSLHRSWIIADGSRRWLVQHQTQQFILFIIGVGNVQVRDVAGAVASMNNGTLNAELEGRLSQGLPIHGAPQIEAIPAPSGIVQAWVARYTRAIAIKITRGSPMGTVELFRLNGRQIKVYELNGKTIQFIAQAFTSGATSTINANVATLLALPAHEVYTQTWIPTQNWWELSIKNWALVGNMLEGLHVSGLTHQNSSIREHLESSQENRNPAAYEKLSTEKTVFPWALPFDLWLEETRAFLEALGIPRAHLIDLARPQSRLSEEAVALELLGVSKSEADLITSATTSTTPWTYWGLAEKNNTVKDHTAGFGWKGNWQEVLAHLSILLQQSGLSYREYLDLLQTNFVEQPKLVLFPPDECQTSKIRLLGLNSTEFTDHVNRVHVFTRLWRKSGWSTRELDLALIAFGGQITPTGLRDLALLKRLRAGLQLPVTVLVGCIHTLETQAWTDHTKEGAPIAPALYDRVFQRQSLRSLTGFDDFAQEKLKNSTLRISDRADVVAASLSIKPDQVRAWIIGTPNLGIADSANLDSLSRMYAAATLCRALSITPDVLPDIVMLLLGSATDLFRTLPAPITPDDMAQQARVRARAMLEFAERVEFVRKSGFDFETLSYLLRHRVLLGKGSDASTRIEQQLTQTLTDLRSALQAGVVLGDVSGDNVKRQFARLDWYPSLIDAAMGSDGLNYQPGASVEIRPPLTNEPTIPLNLRSKFSYQKLDSTTGALKCAGSLNDSDFLNIKNLNLFPSGRVAALKTQYNQQLKDEGEALASLLQIVELPKIPTVTEVVTGLTALPVIPGELKDRLKFEVSSTLATEGNLTLTGWLSDAEKKTVTDANLSLSVVVNKLQANALLKITAPTPQTLKDAEQLLREPDVETRYRTILLRLIPLLEVDLLVAQLSGALGSDPQVVRTLLDVAKVPKNSGRSAKALLTDSELLRSDTKKLVDRAAWPDQFAAIELLSKITAIANRLAIAPEQLEWVLGKAFSVMDVLALPTSATAAATAAVRFDGWRKLVDLFHLRDVLPDGAMRLGQVYEALTRDDKPTVHGVFTKAFELDGQQHVDDACDVGLLNFNATAPAPNDYNNPSRLLELAQLLQVGKVLGTPCSEIKRLIQPKPTKSEAQLARTLFAASINASEFSERLRPISNKLRTLQRDALVAYLIHRDHLADSKELFDRYLIDVDMGSCMLTSRIKQAISSVQLFVQRCLLNLERPVPGSQEPGVTPDSIDTQRWQWMKNYRVWEANRKIFLYPENWIEPELRDDKTEIFRAFESDLLQSELTHDSALVAFRKYLDKMGDIANLTVVSMFEEQTGDGSIVHLVGRDNSEPYKHYYRQWRLRSDADFGTWTAWEEISAQLASEHVLVFVFGGSVYLAWPTISSGQKENLKWKIGMNLAKRSASGWTKLKKGRGEIECPMLPHTMESYTDKTGKPAFRIKYEKDERNSLAFRIEYNNSGKPDETVSIETYGLPPQDVGEEPNETKRELISDFYDAEAEKAAGAGTSNPFLTLNLRVLDSYVYEYAGKVKRTHYRASTQATITIKAEYKYTTPKSLDVFGGWNPATTRTPPKQFAGGSYNGSLGEFIGLEPKKFKVWQPWPTEVERDTFQTLASAIKITATVTRTGFPKPIEKVLQVSKGNSLIWEEDFIFELKDAPDWLPLLPSGNPDLVQAGSFKLKDDDSLALVPASGKDLKIPDNSKNFMSGYQVVDEFGLFMLDPAKQALNSLPLENFIVPASSKLSYPYSPPIYAYRDERFALIFWKRATETGYRMVPFSTGGLRKLTSDVTKGRLSDAVKLPLPGGLLPLTSIPEYGFDQDSVTEIKIDFEKVPTSIYNWEVFFHNPLLVATQLSQAQRFEEAQRWFHLIFDPTTNDTAAESVRYWRFQSFRKAGKGVAIDELLEGLAKQGSSSLMEHINEWAENPFRPHLIARQRLRSYQFAVVQKYVENLVAWGDQLFRRDTIESINEATQLYVLAAKILGKRPASSPKTASSPKSYRDIYRKLDDFSNAWIALEGPIVTALVPALTALYSQSLQAAGLEKTAEQIAEQLSGILRNFGCLYFCVPGNEKLAEYWDTVDNRLFKIRHCMNIEGVERQLPLFEPPIDPALLVRATAAGLDLATVLSDLQAPLPLYRFNVMMQKSLELCGEVRALGNALLSALEKHDAEQLSLLRSSHEIQMLKLVRTIKEQQQQEAETNLEALRKTREITAQRYGNYQRLMGKQNVVVPAEGTVATLEPSSLQLAPPSAGDSDTEGLALIAAEAGHMGWLNDANNFSLIAGIHSVLAGVLHGLPDFIVGPIVAQAKTGGSHLGNAINAAGAAWGMLATNASFQAGRSATIGGHQRRYDEWRFQSNTAAKELEQIDKQILANEIRKQIAEKEITNHDQQMANTLEVDEFMRDKFTKQQLYSWMVGQISKVYFRTYQLAHDLAKRAERTYRLELGLKDKDSSFIEFGYWDSLKKGLLSGERLYLDLKRMDAAYLDKNKREYEITKHVSFMQLNPMALLRLKETGECEVNVPEALLDMDFPGHYLRRIKSVSLTIPCVTGPYSTVPCTLTLLNHSVRHNSNASGNYTRDIENDDPRFIDSFGAIQSIVTSSAQNDSGMFETNLRDERYLPFEGAGVISTWRVELPSEYRQFNYDTISDVIFHIRYTAREGAGIFKTSAIKNIDGLVKNAEAAGSVRLFSVRHEFPGEWAKFKSQTPAANQRFELAITLRPEHYPFWSQGRLNNIVSVEIVARSTQDPVPGSMDIFDRADTADNTKKGTLTKNAAMGNLLRGQLTAGLPATPAGELRFFVETKAMADVWVAVTWGV